MNCFYRMVVLLLLGLCIQGTAHSQHSWEVTRLSQDLVFDGKPDEPAWEEVTPFPFITQQPTYGNPPAQKTVVKLAFDDHYLYLGASLYVDKPDMIKAVGKVRDFNSMSCDWLCFQIDSYNDNRNALVFCTNPNGIRWDATISNDAEPVDGNVPMDLNWDTFWEVKTVIEDRVWHAEMKIPISSLRFESKNGETVMGFNVMR